MLEVLVLRQPRQGLAAGVKAMAKALATRIEHIRRVASVGDIGWRLCEQFHAVQWARSPSWWSRFVATVAAVSWIAARRRQTVIGGALLGA